MNDPKQSFELALARELGLYSDEMEARGVMGLSASTQVELWGERLKVSARLVVFVTPEEFARAMNAAAAPKGGK